MPLLPLPFLQSLEWARPRAPSLGKDLAEAPVAAAPPLGDQAPAALTAVSALGRPTACTQTQQIRTSSTNAVGEKPTLRAVLLVWSLTAHVLAATGPKAEVIDWLVNCSKAGWLCFTFVLTQRVTSLGSKSFASQEVDVKQCKTWGRCLE